MLIINPTVVGPELRSSRHLPTIQDRESNLSDLSTLRTNAISAVEASERATLDLLQALKDGAALAGETRSIRVPLRCPDGLAAATTGAFVNAAQNLIAVLSDPTHKLMPTPYSARVQPPAMDENEKLRRLAELTPGQNRVFKLVVQGLPNKIIGYQLKITETTVKAHVGVILRKLGMYSRVRAIVIFGNLYAENEET